jgi:phosphocarrier protein HPr
MSGKSASRELTVTNPQGLHLRPAHAFVTLANQFASRIEIEKDGERVDGKSILSILALAVAQGTQICLRAIGDDAETALDALAQLLANFPAEENGSAE